MSTNNPKISSYVPQVIYERFKQFQDERNLSMSQAVIVILAEYFGLEQIIEETTKGTTVGGVTLGELQEIKERLLTLEKEVERIKSTNSLQRIEIEKPTQKLKNVQLELPSESISELPVITVELLARRFTMKNPKSIGNYMNKSDDWFHRWSVNKDPDGIVWDKVKLKKGYSYSPISNTPSELLSRLKEWIRACSEGVS